ncbi:MAG: NAD(P)/FAD-dependent oxidoreductase [Candidatus Freyrarchaeum guaymaensis]|nr:NAD(P)/FAD-dependent oxidoreductase [Candidatus Sigynarchaeota archaeon]
MRLKTELLVVGAGPGGTATAISALRKGGKVLIVDRKTNVGVPVQCGEAIGKTGPGLAEIEIPENSKVNPIRGFRIYSPNLTKVDYAKSEPDGYIIDRRIFDKELLAKACEMGAEVLVGANVTDLLYKNDRISGVVARRFGEKVEIEAEVVVGADGVNSTIAKLSGLRKSIKVKDIESCAQYEMVGVQIDDVDLLEFYLGKQVSPRGYVWVFPKSENRANIGLGIGGGMGEKTAFEYLQHFIKHNSRGKEICKKAKAIEFRVGAIPLGGPNPKNVLDNLMLVGDAAGQVHPITGGGMGYAMVCGSIAGKVAVEAITEGDTSEEALSLYEELWLEKYGKEFEQMLKLQRLLAEAEDKLLDKLAQVLTGQNVVELTAGKKIGVFLKAAAKGDKQLLRLLNQLRNLQLVQ